MLLRRSDLNTLRSLCDKNRKGTKNGDLSLFLPIIRVLFLNKKYSFKGPDVKHMHGMHAKFNFTTCLSCEKGLKKMAK